MVANLVLETLLIIQHFKLSYDNSFYCHGGELSLRLCVMCVDPK